MVLYLSPTVPPGAITQVLPQIGIPVLVHVQQDTCSIQIFDATPNKYLQRN